MPSSAHIESLLQSAVRAHFFSAYQLHAEKEGKVLSLCGGVTSYWPGGSPVGPDTIFDIGSITKVVATGTMFALAVERGDISLESTLATELPELGHEKYRDITLGDCLAHVSGLEGWLPIFQEWNGHDLLQWFRENPERARPRGSRQKAVYSDLGFLLLGKVLERRYGKLDEAFQSRVRGPLGLGEVTFGPLGLKPGVAATEFSLSRRRVLQGDVFDENCDALGGVAGHAGLFATARSLAPFCSEWLKARHGASRFLGAPTARLFTEPSRLVPDSTWAYAWDTKSAAGSTSGSLFSPESFGILGYPGCSVWVDPKAGGFVILFTNRVHPSRFDERIRQLRPKLHDAIALYWRK